jgi:hypothetical protein
MAGLTDAQRRELARKAARVRRAQTTMTPRRKDDD